MNLHSKTDIQARRMFNNTKQVNKNNNIGKNEQETNLKTKHNVINEQYKEFVTDAAFVNHQVQYVEQNKDL